MKLFEPLKHREKYLLRSWMLLKPKEDSGVLGHMKNQPALYFVSLGMLLSLAIFTFMYSGLSSFSSGLFVGLLAGVFSVVMRSHRDWKIIKKYLDWELVEKTNEKNT